MRTLAIGALLVLSGTPSGDRRANFLDIAVTKPRDVVVHAIWRPYYGAVSVTGEEQQRRLIDRMSRKWPQDSLRRWGDPASRDTVSVTTPVDFVVDMSGGPIVIETISGDSVRVEAQLTPGRGPVVAVWARAFRVDADGIRPHVERIR